MSVLRSGDQEMHHSDGSHRWICPDPDGDQDAWTDRVRAHLEEHGGQRAELVTRRLLPHSRPMS